MTTVIDFDDKNVSNFFTKGIRNFKFVLYRHCNTRCSPTM